MTHSGVANDSKMLPRPVIARPSATARIVPIACILASNRAPAAIPTPSANWSSPYALLPYPSGARLYARTTRAGKLMLRKNAPAADIIRCGRAWCTPHARDKPLNALTGTPPPNEPMPTMRVPATMNVAPSARKSAVVDPVPRRTSKATAPPIAQLSRLAAAIMAVARPIASGPTTSASAAWRAGWTTLSSMVRTKKAGKTVPNPIRLIASGSRSRTAARPYSSVGIRRSRRQRSGNAPPNTLTIKAATACAE